MSDFDTFDLYQVLGVERDASEAEIRDAFNRAALTEHPDRSGHPDAEQRIRRVYEARDTLLNARLRAAYDPDADQRERRLAQQREGRTPPRPPPTQPPRPPPQAPPPPPPRQPEPTQPQREGTDREDERSAAQEELRDLAGSTILTQRRWFRADSDRQHYYPDAYAEFQSREQRYLNALRLVPGLLFALLAVGSFATGDIVGGVISLIIALVAFMACRYLAEREWFIWPYLIVAVPTVELAKLAYAALRVAVRFIGGKLRERWAARASSSNSDD